MNNFLDKGNSFLKDYILVFYNTSETMTVRFKILGSLFLIPPILGTLLAIVSTISMLSRNSNSSYNHSLLNDSDSSLSDHTITSYFPTTAANITINVVNNKNKSDTNFHYDENSNISISDLNITVVVDLNNNNSYGYHKNNSNHNLSISEIISIIKLEKENCYSSWFFISKLYILVQIIAIIVLLLLSFRSCIDKLQFPPHTRVYIANLIIDSFFYLSIYIVLSHIIYYLPLFIIEKNYSSIEIAKYYNSYDLITETNNNSIISSIINNNIVNSSISQVFSPVIYFLIFKLSQIVLLRSKEPILKSFSIISIISAWFTFDNNSSNRIFLFSLLTSSLLMLLFYFYQYYDVTCKYKASYYDYKVFSIINLNDNFVQFVIIVLSMNITVLLYMLKYNITITELIINIPTITYLIVVINSSLLSIFWVNREFYYFFFSYERKIRKKVLLPYYSQFVVNVKVKAHSSFFNNSSNSMDSDIEIKDDDLYDDSYYVQERRKHKSPIVVKASTNIKSDPDKLTNKLLASRRKYSNSNNSKCNSNNSSMDSTNSNKRRKSKELILLSKEKEIINETENEDDDDI